MDRKLLIAVFLVSSAAISFEILLMRILSITHWHHFAWMIISLALLGYGASGTVIAIAGRWLEPKFNLAFAVSALLFSLSIIVCVTLGQRIPFNALEVIWNPAQFLYLGAMYLVYILPFLFAAACIGLAFTFRQALIERIYFADLVGAGIGALLIMGLLFLLAPSRALIFLSVLALAASVTVGGRGQVRGRLLVLAQAAWVVVLLAGLQQDWSVLRPSEFKGLSQSLEVVGSRVLAEKSSPLGLLTVVESPRVPFRHAPGLSFNARSLPPRQLGVFTDGDGMTVINRFDGELAAVDYLGDVTAALPYRLLDRPEVLVLGSGAGSDVLLALHEGAARVDAVELNPQMIALVRNEFAAFAGPVYDFPGVEIHLAEARAYIARSDRRFNLIQVGLLDSSAVAGSGIQALNENYLYTVEAIESYLQQLKPGGLLAITRWLRIPPRESLKLVTTVIEAMRNLGIDDPGSRLVVIRSWNTVTLLVAEQPIGPEDIAVVREFSQSRFFDTAWYPSMPPAEANRFNQLDWPYLYQGIASLLAAGGQDFIDRYKFQIAPATDNRPYFFHFFKWRALPEVLSLRKRGGASLVEWGYPVLIATLLQAALAGSILILLPLARFRPSAGVTSRMGGYFFLLGLAFLFIEMAFIQKFILFLGHPLYSVAVVLAGFLVFAGAGSAFAGKVTRGTGTDVRPAVRVAVLAIIAVSLLYVFLLPVLFENLIGLGALYRIMISISLIAPLAFFMGIPFPLGLKRVARLEPGFIPWAWGINGFASVISAVLATILAVHFGFTAVLLTALAFYGSAWLIFRR